MVLTASDKREIAALFESFSERLTTGQQSRPVERFVYDVTTNTIIPAVAAGAQAFTQAPPIGIQRPEDILLAQAVETVFVPTKRKRAMTKFNRAVKEGMKIVKQSTSYGKKGTISNSRKAFSAVNKVISNVNKGKKITAKGVLRKVALKAKKIIGKRGKPSRKTYISSLRKRLRIRK